MDVIKEAEQLFAAIRSVSRDGEGVTRPSYSSVESEAMGVVAEYAMAAGLFVSQDAAGNIYVSQNVAGMDSNNVRSVYCGSHMDSVPMGGNYDGAAGVVAGVLALKNIDSYPEKPKTPIRVAMLRGEESAWFGKCYLGSSAIFGKLSEDDLARNRRGNSESLRRRIGAEFFSKGGNTAACAIKQGVPLIDPKMFAAFLELHIEQGPCLEKTNTSLGIVTGICGNVRVNVVCRGEAGHSGTTPMKMRHDAVAATADLLHELNVNIGGAGMFSENFVMTVGRLHTDASKDAVSVIPDTVSFTIEWRSIEERLLVQFGKMLTGMAHEAGRRHGVKFEFDKSLITKPADMCLSIQAMLMATVREQAVSCRLMPSGAGHDAAVFAAEGIPTGMIFVRNQNGSHNPREDMRMDDFAMGVKVLEKALWKLANE